MLLALGYPKTEPAQVTPAAGLPLANEPQGCACPLNLGCSCAQGWHQSHRSPPPAAPTHGISLPRLQPPADPGPAFKAPLWVYRSTRGPATAQLGFVPLQWENRELFGSPLGLPHRPLGQQQNDRQARAH